MLSAGDFALIIVTTLVCTAVVSAVGAVALRLNRRGSIASQFGVVIVTSVAAIVVSTIAIVVEMYVSEHDVAVLSWIVGVSAVVSLAAAWFVTGRLVRSSIRRLSSAAKQLGETPAAERDAAVGEARDAVRDTAGDAAAWREFTELDAALSDASRRLAAARAEIESLDAARRRFFAWISHDLRTPLAGLAAMAEALEAGVAPDPEEYLRLIRAKVDTLGGMVDDLFQLSKLESGTFELHPEVVELLDLVSDAVADVQPLAVRRGIRIVQSGVDGHTLWADPRELTRAIGNLLSNSIRHAPDQTEIVVSASTRSDGHLEISVLDHGSGVATEDLGRIFDIGWRASTARTTDAQSAASPGAGLGLAIVRGIVEAHGGNVAAQDVDGGFRVALLLPAGQAGQAGRHLSVI